MRNLGASYNGRVFKETVSKSFHSLACDSVLTPELEQEKQVRVRERLGENCMAHH